MNGAPKEPYPRWNPYFKPWYHAPSTWPFTCKDERKTRKLSLYPLYKKNTNNDVHIEVFKRIISANEETNDCRFVNIFWRTFKNTIFECGANLVKNHLNYIFAKIQQTVYKHYRKELPNE
jgi:hypothetical protein